MTAKPVEVKIGQFSVWRESLVSSGQKGDKMQTALRETLLLSISFCTAALNYVDECPFGLQWFEIDNHLYGVSVERTSYPIAKNCCENQGGHTRLTILDSEVDGLFVMKNLVAQFPNRQFWVDAKRIDRIGFTWPNGSVVNESFWEINPTINSAEDCVFVHTNGKLRRNTCSSGNFSVYCQAYCPPTTTTVTTYACEGNFLKITCPTGEHINIVRAFYGRSSVTVCIDIASHMTNLKCNSTNAFGNISSRCNGYQSCGFWVGNEFFNLDPCGGTSKYAQVVHACVNGNTSSLTTNSSSMPGITQSYQTEPSTQEIPTQPARCSSTNNDFTTSATSYSDFTTVVKETATMFETTPSPKMSTTSVQLENQSTAMIETTTPASTAITMPERNLPVSTPARKAVTMTETNLPVSTKHYLCTCQFFKPGVNFSSEDSIQQIKKELSINKSSLSSSIRRRTSSKDGRPSAQTVGSLGVFLLCVPVIFIVCLDLQRFLVHIQTQSSLSL